MTAMSRIGEVWRFREVVKNFVSQDLKVKYRRSFLGFFWSLLNPLLQMTVISVVFSVIFKFPVEHYALYVLSGLIPWAFFSATIDGCSTSIVSSEPMLKRQYFPKLVFPLSVVMQNMVTFVLSLTVLLCILGPFSGFRLSPALLIVPLSFLCIFSVALGLGAFAAVVTVYFRDMQHLIAVFISAWFYLTPIIYPMEAKRPAAAPPLLQADKEVRSSPGDRAVTGVTEGPTSAAIDEGPIPHRYRFYFKLNPMYGVIEMFHRPIYDARLPTRSEMLSAVGTATAALVLGLAVFWRYEDRLIFTL